MEIIKDIAALSVGWILAFAIFPFIVIGFVASLVYGIVVGGIKFGWNLCKDWLIPIYDRTVKLRKKLSCKL